LFIILSLLHFRFVLFVQKSFLGPRNPSFIFFAVLDLAVITAGRVSGVGVGDVSIQGGGVLGDVGGDVSIQVVVVFKLVVVFWVVMVVMSVFRVVVVVVVVMSVFKMAVVFKLVVVSLFRWVVFFFSDGGSVKKHFRV
jgi:hypothetical protein